MQTLKLPWEPFLFFVGKGSARIEGEIASKSININSSKYVCYSSQQAELGKFRREKKSHNEEQVESHEHIFSADEMHLF